MQITVQAEPYLHEPDSDADCDARTAERSLVIRNGPWVLLELLEEAGQLELDLRDGQEKAGGTRVRGRDGLTWSRGSAVLGTQVEHLLNLLRGVLLAASEDVGLGAFGVPEFVNLSLCGLKWLELDSGRILVATHHSPVRNETNESVWGEETQADDDGITNSLQTNIILTQVDHEEEDGGCLSRS